MTAVATSRGWWRRLRERRAARHADPYTPEERARMREANVEANALRRHRCRRRQSLTSQPREASP